ncbi:TetR/AcrR family transcriptional regulator [Streptomyces olivaceus]|uniref:TetR/AcrR family transcriptional regulator n=1 Tax=Streptomyces olivaceus TaxID=47716 RepID=UPI001CC8EF0E|nr:TetR/AcrR family transcriptional regulator [Streptomyces olivaceus]MBZ6288433.1 TetR/AcrR family transcriptional regulator [Streptomyces olivaceus]
MNTAQRLVAAAAELLDEGGQAAVTLRAVGSAAGVSHNAPYKHFTSRDDLLAAVAAADFTAITESWRTIGASPLDPAERLLDALDIVIRFSGDHPARYRLLFGTPDVAARGGPLGDAAETALQVFSDIVVDCQRTGALPPSSSNNLGIIIFATAHGLIDADASGRLRSRSGWTDVRAGLRFLIGLLREQPTPHTPPPTTPSDTPAQEAREI